MLHASECSSVNYLKIYLESLGCVVLKNVFFLVYVTMSTNSWLYFTLIGCWLAMSENTLLNSIILKNPKSISC
jgi:hypothetical protein